MISLTIYGSVKYKWGLKSLCLLDQSAYLYAELVPTLAPAQEIISYARDILHILSVARVWDKISFLHAR